MSNKFISPRALIPCIRFTAISKYLGLISKPIHCNPSLLAASRLVAEPQNGSKTIALFSIPPPR